MKNKKLQIWGIAEIKKWIGFSLTAFTESTSNNNKRQCLTALLDFLTNILMYVLTHKLLNS